MQRSALCRSRRELSNAYLLAKIGVDTAESEPLEVWGENSIQYSLHSLGAAAAAARPSWRRSRGKRPRRPEPEGDGRGGEVAVLSSTPAAARPREERRRRLQEEVFS